MFSDTAILFCLMVKVFFGLFRRQTTDMVSRILKIARLNCPAHDFYRLSRCQKTIIVRLSFRRPQASLDLLLDRSRIKFLDDGEWLVKKHGTHHHRQYRKVHLAMDTATGDIPAVEFTSSRKC